MQENAALTTAPRANVAPSAGEVIETAGLVVSVGQIVVVERAIDELGKHFSGRSALPRPDGRSALTVICRPKSE